MSVFLSSPSSFSSVGHWVNLFLVGFIRMKLDLQCLCSFVSSKQNLCIHIPKLFTYPVTVCWALLFYLLLEENDDIVLQRTKLSSLLDHSTPL